MTITNKHHGYWTTRDVLSFTGIKRSTFYAHYKDDLQAQPTTRFAAKGPRRPLYWPETVKQICLAEKPPENKPRKIFPVFHPPDTTQQEVKEIHSLNQTKLPGFDQ